MLTMSCEMHSRSVVRPAGSDVALLLQASIARGLAYAPYADMLWMETSTPSLEEAREFADAIHAKYPGKIHSVNMHERI